MLCQLSYRGIHWETTRPGHAAASDFGAKNESAGKKKQKQNSMSGNRTPGVCVTGRNVTNYTNTD